MLQAQQEVPIDAIVMAVSRRARVDSQLQLYAARYSIDAEQLHVLARAIDGVHVQSRIDAELRTMINNDEALRRSRPEARGSA